MKQTADRPAPDYADLLSHTQALYPTLTKSEKKVADLLLSDPAALVYDTISDLADRAAVGDATVLRFCRRLGYKGFFPFRLALAQHVMDSRPAAGDAAPATPAAETQDTPAGILRRAVQDAQHVLDSTARMLSPDALNRVAALLSDAQGRICFFGLGSSNNAAMEAMGKFMRIGMHTASIADTHMQLMMASLLGPGDVALGFSVSGSTKDMEEIMQAAKNTGAATVCITGNARSPIGRLCDEALLMASRESPFEGGSAEARLSQSLVINALFGCVLARRSHDTAQARRKVTRAIESRMV